MKKSIIYSNIHLYRLITYLLYGFKYRKRFTAIIDMLEQNDKKIVELCFGDIYIAEFCKKNSREWLGIDFNEKFVKRAARKYNCICADLNGLESFPQSDVCIMSSSLYHFHDNAENIMKKMVLSSKKVIISEPVLNISSSGGIIGRLARAATSAGSGPENFRFNEETFLSMINRLKHQLNFDYSIISRKRDILIMVTK
jgi:hypothetical protein